MLQQGKQKLGKDHGKRSTHVSPAKDLGTKKLSIRASPRQQKRSTDPHPN